MRHLRNAHPNLDIILAPTVWNLLAPADVLNDLETDLFDTNEQFKTSNSGYESDPAEDTASTATECNTPNDTLMQEPKTDVTKHNWHPVAAEQKDYPGASEANQVVKKYNEERRALCENPWAPIDCTQGFKPAFWVIESKVSMRKINNYF